MPSAREPQVAEPARRLRADLALRILEKRASSGLADEGELALRSAGRLEDSSEEGLRREVHSEGRAGQRSLELPGVGDLALQPERELARGREVHQLDVALAEGPLLGIRDRRREELPRLTLPARVVDDVLAAGRETRLSDPALAERNLLEGRLRVASDVHGSRQPRRRRGSSDGGGSGRGPSPTLAATTDSRASAVHHGDRRDRLEVEREVLHGLETALGCLLETVQDETFERRRHVPLRDDERAGLVVKDRVQRLDGRLALERLPSAEHLVQDDPEREDVAPMVGAVSPHLLGTHVAHGPHDDAGLRGMAPSRLGRNARLRAARAGPLRQLLREAEIQQLHAAVAAEEDVLRLHVPVDDSALVRRGEALGDLGCDFERLFRRERAGPEALAQRLAFEQLHDENGDRRRRG